MILSGSQANESCKKVRAYSFNFYYYVLGS